MTGLLPAVRPPAADRDLLRAFLADRSEPAFTELVRRHGPVVYGVCRRVLGDRHDAEDAFQAAFLVLARKAGDVRKPDALASWLYGVAFRTARELRHMRDRRRKNELRARSVSEGKPKTLADASGSDLTAVLDEELARLPEHYRLAVVLCELHGRSRKQAAVELGVPEGTLSSRLAMAKKRLAARLTKRGFAATASAVSAVLASEADARVSPEFALGTARSIVGAEVSPVVALAADGVVKALFVSKLKGLAVAVGVLAAGVGGLVVMTGGVGASPRPPARAADEIGTLVKQLGSPSFAEREAAEKRLLELGARAEAAVRTGTTDPDAEIAARCKDLLPRLAVAALAVPTHPVWQRFKRTVGGDDASRNLYLEMAADPRRAEVLRTVESNPAKAAELYEAELKLRVAELTKGYEDSAERYKNFTGLVWPTSGIPTRGELATLLYLGTFPATAKVTYKATGQWDGTAHYNVFGLGLGLKPPLRKLEAEIPPALRRLFVAWLTVRDDPEMLRFGLGLAVNGDMTDILPAARMMAAKADLDAPTRGKAILAVGQYGTKEDTPLLAKALTDDRVHWSSNFTDEKGVKTPTASQVRDLAAAALLKLHGRSLAESGFTFIAKYKMDGPDVLQKSVWLTFMDNEAREAMHAKVKAWLATVK